MNFIYFCTSHDVSHSQSLALTEMSHSTFIFRGKITAGNLNCCIHFPVNDCISTPPIPDSSRRRRSAFSFVASHVNARGAIRVILYTSIASEHTQADTVHILTQTHIEETPPVWVFKSKQTLMSHLSVSLTSVLLLEKSFSTAA